METTKKTTAKKAPVKKAVATKPAATKIAITKPVAKKASAKKAIVAPAEVVATPAHEQISQRAYLIWANRGFTHGNHNQDWIQAERELKRA